MEELEHIFNQVRFINNASEALSSTSCKKLKSYLNTYRTILAGHGRLVLPKEVSSRGMVCEYCLNSWTTGDFSLKLVPHDRGGKKIRRILKKQEQNKPLSLLEKKLAALAHSGNKLVLTCHMCHKQSSFLISKVQAAPSVQTPVISNETPGKEKNKKKKKKKKKDKFAGLTPVVQKSVMKTSVMLPDINDESNDSIIVIDPEPKIEVKNEIEELVEDGSIVIDRVGQQFYRPSTSKMVINEPAYNKKSNVVLGKEEEQLKRFQTPLGMKIETPLIKSEALPFISLGNTKGDRGHPHRRKQTLKKMVLNPFANDVQSAKKSKKKKAQLLQDLIKEEEKSKHFKKKSSLESFLSLV